jgi:glycosyltransferase involved in cell wall biosynthesis
MISELHPTKRIDDAIRAFAYIAERHPDAILLVIGEEGAERESLERLIRNEQLEDRVFLRGRVPDARAYLKAFDLFVHSSQSEALALAILEAGYASLPVVATRVGGIPEIIEDQEHGLLVPARNPEKLSEAMESLMVDPARAAKLGTRLHDRVTSYFSTERMVSETLSLYRA